ELGTLCNRRFDLARDLPLRILVFVGAPTPTVVFNLHHIAGDGRAMIELLSSFMALLNGQTPTPLALDPPSMVPALLPQARGLRPLLSSLWRSFLLHRRSENQRKRHRPLTRQRPGDFGPTKVRLHVCAASATAMKQLAATEAASLTDVVVTALAQAFAAKTQPDGTQAVSARLSLDLRPHFPPDQRPRFGNYVASFLVQLPQWNDFAETLRDVRTQIRDWRTRFADRLMSTPLLLAELTPRLLGRRLLARAATALKRRGRLAPVTFHFSNLGSVDALNRLGPHARLDSLHFFTPAVGPYVGCIGLNDRLCLAVTYPAWEISDTEVDAVLASFDSHIAAFFPQSITTASPESSATP
ncbi:MAG TPA: hypothetical protein VGG33_20935, partial [Polyangia bacterium]